MWRSHASPTKGIGSKGGGHDGGTDGTTAAEGAEREWLGLFQVTVSFRQGAPTCLLAAPLVST